MKQSLMVHYIGQNLQITDHIKYHLVEDIKLFLYSDNNVGLILPLIIGWAALVGGVVAIVVSNNDNQHLSSNKIAKTPITNNNNGDGLSGIGRRDSKVAEGTTYSFTALLTLNNVSTTLDELLQNKHIFYCFNLM